jgi:hypothetical protein
MKKRIHKNTTRLTARDRAVRACGQIGELQSVQLPAACSVIHDIIERALQAHARQTVARHNLHCKGVIR